jgi:hypothetical protein
MTILRLVLSAFLEESPALTSEGHTIDGFGHITMAKTFLQLVFHDEIDYGDGYYEKIAIGLYKTQIM